MLTTEELIQNPEAIKYLTGIPFKTVNQVSLLAEATCPVHREQYLAERPRLMVVGGKIHSEVCVNRPFDRGNHEKGTDTTFARIIVQRAIREKLAGSVQTV